MQTKSWLLFVIGLLACAISCVSPGSHQLDSPRNTVELSKTSNAKAQAAPKPPAGGISGVLPNPNQPPTLIWNPQSRNLRWNYNNLGDYNQDGEANAADVSQIAVYFGACHPFDDSGLATVVDGDNNGEVNLADITPIVLNNHNRVTQYYVYSSASVDDIPTNPDAANGSGTKLVTTVDFADAVAVDRQRKAFTLHQHPEAGGFYVWVRAVENGVEGFASNAVSVGKGTVATLAGQPISGTTPLSVTLDGSLSQGGAKPITAYLWDFDGDGEIDLDSGLSSVVEHTYHDAGSYIARLTVATSMSVSQPATLPINVSPSGFEFQPWDETYIGGGEAGGFEITPTDLGDSIEIEIHSDNAIGIAALFGSLSYDQDALRFVECVPGDALESLGELLSFYRVAPESRLHIGLCTVSPQDEAGLFGDQLMATIVFDKEPEPPVDLSFCVPQDSTSAITNLSASNMDNTMIWRYNSCGDYNQDGTVKASDLAVLAYYWNQSGPFYHNSTASLADADNDLLISDSDLNLIGLNYYHRVAGFGVFGSSNSADYPSDANAANGIGTQNLGYLPLNAGLSNVLENRLRFVFAVPGDTMPEYLWIRPVLNGDEGVPSNLVEPTSEFFISPNWIDSDWDDVTGSGSSASTELKLGAAGDGRTFSLIASTQPNGQGSLIDVATLTWEVLPSSSGTFPETAVFVPRSPIAIGYISASNGIGVTSNKLYFFAGASPGG